MTGHKDSILLIYPEVFSRNPGALRLRRMVRALVHKYQVIILTKGPKTTVRKVSWGFVLVTKAGKKIDKKQEKNTLFEFSSFKGILANALLSPDAGVWWAYKVQKIAIFRPYFRRCHTVISSSPPNSIHLLAKKIAKTYQCRWLMDMRDGWLDEPLKRTLLFLKPLESYQEKSCLLSCDLILANTALWKEKLLFRNRALEGKIEILMNSVELSMLDRCSLAPVPTKDKYLLYAGSFRLSDKKREAKFLLKPLLSAMMESSIRRVVLLGNFNDLDRQEISLFQNLMKGEISIELVSGVSREELSKFLMKASGFLLTSHSLSALPSKFFDYLACSRPILGFCPKGSSLEAIAKDVESVFTVDLWAPQKEVLKHYLAEVETLSAPFSRDLLSFSEKGFQQTLLSFL